MEFHGTRQAKRQVTPRCCVERPFWWDAAVALKWSGTFDWHPRLDTTLGLPCQNRPVPILGCSEQGINLLQVYFKYLAYFWLIMVVKIIPVTSAAIYLIILRILVINVNRRLLQDVFFRISSIKLYEKSGWPMFHGALFIPGLTSAASPVAAPREWTARAKRRQASSGSVSGQCSAARATARSTEPGSSREVKTKSSTVKP